MKPLHRATGWRVRSAEVNRTVTNPEATKRRAIALMKWVKNRVR